MRLLVVNIEILSPSALCLVVVVVVVLVFVFVFVMLLCQLLWVRVMDKHYYFF